jgi:alpha-L-rhamnosidase
LDKIERKGQFIWYGENKSPDQHILFKKTIVLSESPVEAVAHIAVDTRYWFYINGSLIIFEGGLYRESLPGCGYADSLDLAPYLLPGENTLIWYVQYYGNEGRNNQDSGSPCFLFQCDSLNLFSDRSFQCQIHPSYFSTGAPYPAYLYGGYNIGFDNRKDIRDSDYVDSSIVSPSFFGNLYERPIPNIQLMGLRKGTYTKTGDCEYSLKLPYAMAMSPCFNLTAEESTIIDIRTDRYSINGGPDDDENQYNSHRIEYICREGNNRFESLHYLFGEEIIITSNNPIDIDWLGFRESGYNTEIIGRYTSSCEILNKLVEKSARTLYVCMRDNFMDCPDRERGQWIGDVSVQASQIFFLLSTSARALLKKSIMDFINLRKGDILVGNVPGVNFCELPAQSLNAISELGMIATYYKYTGDRDVIEKAFEPCVRYLKLWEMGQDGLVIHREGNWDWLDHLHNIDKAVLSNSWYYSALKFALSMSVILNNNNYDKFLTSRIESIENCFNKLFWKGNYYSSNGVVDDRANALAVLTGLCPESHFQKVRFVLQTTFNSSIYMEGYVLSALCEMGFHKDAYLRLRSRYYNLAVNENSTLWEDFFILGSKNHAWSGSPAVIAFKYFMGIDTDDGFTTHQVNPVPGLFEYQKIQLPLPSGEVVTYEYKDNRLKKS